MQDDCSQLCGRDSTWHRQGVEVCFIDGWEEVCRQGRKEAAVQSHAEISIVRADWIVDCYQVRACLEGCFDLHLLQGTNDRRVYMSTAQDSLAKIHEIRDRMVLVVDDLTEVSNDNKHDNEGEMYLMKDSSNKSLSMLVGERMNRRIDIYSSFQVIQLLPFQKTPLGKSASLREEQFL